MSCMQHLIQKSSYSWVLRNRLYRLSMQIAPKGAVIRIDKTATANTVCPHLNPIVRGIAPIAAWTVAFGVYAIMQNHFSCFVSPVLNNDIATPDILNINVPTTNRTAKIPAAAAYLKSTVAPTSTNRKISAAIQSLLYFMDNRSANLE